MLIRSGNFITHDITLQKGTNNEDLIVNNETWNLAPNPTDGVITINLLSKENKTINFLLTDLTGRTLLSKKVEVIKGTNSFKLNLQSQNRIVAGTYYLKAIGLEADKIKKVIVR